MATRKQPPSAPYSLHDERPHRLEHDAERLKSASIRLENKKYWLAIIVFVTQSAGTLYYIGTQTQSVRDAVDVLRRDVGKLEANASLFIALSRDTALLQAKDAEMERRILKLESERK
jgi:hypothetical protein